MTRDDIISLREQADDWAEKHLQCQGEYHPDFHAVSDERFAALVRDRMIADGWRQCAKGQRTSQFCGMVEQEREACARVCESIATETYGMTNLREYGECSAAIRARGQQQEPDDGNPSF